MTTLPSDASPERLVVEAKAAYAAEQYAEAAEKFAAAAEAYQQQGQPLEAAEMRNNQSVALVQAGAFAEALNAVEGTDRIFSEAGDLRRQGLALGNKGAALDGLKRWQEAASAYQQAAELLEKAGDKEAKVAVLQALSAVKLRLNEPVEALIAMQDAVDDQPRSAKKWLLKRLLKAPFRLWRGG